MKITDIRLRKMNGDSKLRAIASVTFDDEFVVHDVRVIEGPSGFFVAMPSRKTPDGDFRDVAHPITAEAREAVQNAVLRAYESLEAKQEEQAARSG